jgi:hypothetical protein
MPIALTVVYCSLITTSVDFLRSTRRYIPEDGVALLTQRRRNLKPNETRMFLYVPLRNRISSAAK